MSRYYASIYAGRGEETRAGQSFAGGHVRTWRCGVEVRVSRSKDGLLDVFEIYRTGGSEIPGKKEKVAEFHYDPAHDTIEVPGGQPEPKFAQNI